MELIANEAEAYLVCGQLKEKWGKREMTFIYNTRTDTSVAHTALTIQDKGAIQDK